jgi:ATP-binding cassette subfamily C protein CydD
MREVSAQQGAVRTKSRLRERLFAHLLHLGPAYTRDERTGELTTTATEGVEKLEPYFARYLPQRILSATVPLLVAAFILPLDWASSVLLLVTAPVIPVLMVLVGSYAEEHLQRQWVALSRMGAKFLDALQGLPTLKMFGRSAEEQGRVEAASEEFRERTMKVLRFAFLSGLVLEFMTAMAIALVAVTLGVRLISGDMPFDKAFLVLLLAPEFYKPLRELGAHRHAGMEGKAAAERIFEILNTPAPLDNNARNPVRSSGELTVELCGVDFSYPGSKSPALHGVGLALRPGTRTALVGPSGSGKSTLVNLILRFWDPTEGEIRLGGHDIREYRQGDLRDAIGVVSQDTHIFNDTLRRNLLLASLEATDAELEEALEKAWLAELGGRLDSYIGEQGLKLSGGERQRLSVARTLLEDAPILVLDEATANLDPVTEHELLTTLYKPMPGRAALVVTHRLVELESMDEILVLDGGRIVERGTHETLVEAGGLYKRMLDVQHGMLMAAGGYSCNEP